MRLSDRIQCCGVVGAALGPAALPPYSPGCRHADQLVSASGPLASIALPMCSRTDSPCYRQYSLLLYRQALHVGDALGTQSLPWGLAWPYSMREDFCLAGVNPGLEAVAGGGSQPVLRTLAHVYGHVHTHTHTLLLLSPLPPLTAVKGVIFTAQSTEPQQHGIWRFSRPVFISIKLLLTDIAQTRGGKNSATWWRFLAVKVMAETDSSQVVHFNCHFYSMLLKLFSIVWRPLGVDFNSRMLLHSL